ncbi:hypothetical protein K505DRAFT_151342 [Melanomma pulvis-pyrius CBS 109.77]|uniref:Uncharacterized protein n=1 Tax=Melanomma pulvis-pyrius CBS 109.77 TaxID=1314802 RepID=A0A6A6XKH9_9PLEO|nr:hypothetical protein K505DRAFT_151342 [Melanomma pulvis-pyrius CBS 109.77]
MSPIGVNMAVTVDGEPYNKLRRPDQVPGSPAASPSSNPPLPATVSDKRKRDEDEDRDPERDGKVYSKRPRANSRDKKAKKVGKSGSYRVPKDTLGRLPVSDGECSDDDECTIQARAFLRSAREEERTLNHALLLVDTPPQLQAHDPDQSTYKNGHRNARASYKHGYYFAREPRGHTQDEPPDLQPQDQYYLMLVKRYQALRRALANNVVNRGQLKQRMKDEPSKCTNKKPPSNRHEWLYVLNREYPSPAQVNQLDDYNIARGLKYSAHGMDRSDTISKQKSCWIWALLAKACEVDTMLSENVSPIRDLALQAGRLGNRLRGADVQQSESSYEDEDKDVEDWHVDNFEPDFEGNEHSSEEDIELPEDDIDILNPDTELLGEDTSLIGKGMQSPQQSIKPLQSAVKNDPEPKDESSTESGADMSMSEEGEVQDDAEPATLEEARARLLAQLGDRLVQPQANSNSQTQKVNKGESEESSRDAKNYNASLQSLESSSPPQAGRHRHNGKVCHDPSCAVGKRRRTLKAGHRATQGNRTHRDRSPSPHERPIPSRADAEAQRQAIREKELIQNKSENDVESRKATPLDEKPIGEATSTTNPSKSSQKIEEKAHDKAPQGDVEMADVEIPDLNTRVTVDMILTVAAECYGQKDLLKYRNSWVT